MSALKINNVGFNSIKISGINNTINISQSGLLLHLDPSNVNSYSGSGVQWNDLSSYGNDVTLVNGVTHSGNSFIFDGDDDYVEFGTVPLNDELQLASSFTISFWVKWNGAGDDYQRLVDKSNGASGTNGYALMIGNVENINCLGYYSYGSSTPVIESSIEVPTNEWVEYTIAYNHSTNIISLYKNGVFDISQTYSGNPNQQSGMRIGTWYSTGREYNGKFGATYIYNRALDSAEILENHTKYLSLYQ